MIVLVPFLIVASGGFLAGLARAKFQAAPTIASGAIVIAYIILLVVTGAWVAACPDCGAWQDYDATRMLGLYMAVPFGAVMASIIIGLIWFGALLSLAGQRLLQRLRA